MTLTARAFAAVAFFGLLGLVALAASCGGGDDAPDVDIKDFDTARFTMTEATSGRSGEGVIDNRKQALSVVYSDGQQLIAIGRTEYRSGVDRWVSFESPTDGRVGLGRPYWPEFWRDAVRVERVEELNPEGRESSEITGYLLTLDPDVVKRSFSYVQGPSGEPEVRQAEVEVWVDKETRYVVRFTFRLEMPVGTTGTAKVELSSRFSDYGTEVQIEAPQGPVPTEAPPEETAPSDPPPTEPATLGQG